MRMTEFRGELDLAEKSVAAERLCELRFQDLECDVAIVLQVVREVDRRHAAGAELALDGVSAGKSGVEAVRLRAHFFPAVLATSSRIQLCTTIISTSPPARRSMRNSEPSGETS